LPKARHDSGVRPRRTSVRSSARARIGRQRAAVALRRACSIRDCRRSSAGSAGGRTRTSGGSAASTGLNGRMSQPRKPQTRCEESSEPPPSLTTKGGSPPAIWRKNVSEFAVSMGASVHNRSELEIVLRPGRRR
jgi:hypothetical protein